MESDMLSPLPLTVIPTVVIGERGSAKGKPSVGTAAAVERVPVEVWHKVLRITISCPLIPREDDDYFQRREVEDSGCAKIYQYVKSEQIRTKLRLVCHSWDIFLSGHSDRLVHLSSVIPGGHWPPVKKWDHVVRLVGSKSLTCRCVDWCPLTDRIKRSMCRRRDGASYVNASMEDRIKWEYLPLISNRCRVIISPYGWKNDLLDRERFGSVTMLTVELMDPTTQLSIISATYRKLTHFNVTLPSPVNPLLLLSLPQLTTLTLCVINPRPRGAEGPTIVGCWLLPQLRHLTLLGPFPEEAIYHLLDQVGSNVTEFHMRAESPTWKVLKPMTSSRLWSFLPSVSIFGTSCMRLLSLSPPVDRHDHPINLIIHFGEDQQYCVPEEVSLTLFQQRWASSTVGQMIIDISWTQWISISKGFPQWFYGSALRTHVRMFDVFNGVGSGLRDLDGVLFGGTIRTRLSAVVEKLDAD